MKELNDYQTTEGTTVSLRLRKLGVDFLPTLGRETAPSNKAVLYIEPEGRTPEEVRKVFKELDVSSQLQLLEDGWKLNEDNLKKYIELGKKQQQTLGHQTTEELLESLMSNPKITRSLLSVVEDVQRPAGEVRPEAAGKEAEAQRNESKTTTIS